MGLENPAARGTSTLIWRAVEYPRTPRLHHRWCAASTVVYDRHHAQPIRVALARAASASFENDNLGVGEGGGCLGGDISETVHPVCVAFIFPLCLQGSTGKSGRDDQERFDTRASFRAFYMDVYSLN